MKTITKHLKVLAVLMALLGFNKSHSQTCTASFNYIVFPNGNVTFTSNSIGTNSISTQYYWSFGNGQTFTATGGFGMIPTTTYTASGVYTVSLFFITVPSCSAAVTQTIAVNVVPPPPCAININTTAVSGTNICNGTLTLAGSATVVGVTGNWCAAPSYTWYPGGMTGVAAFQLCPNVTYTVVASSASGTNCCSSASNTFAINGPTAAPCNLNASFTYSLGANGQVSFNNTSTGTNSISTTYTYSFGNGLSSSQPNPSTTYTANGGYWVFFWANNGSNCWDSTSAYINISNVSSNPCNVTAGFSYTVGANGLVNFVSTSIGTIPASAYIWSFGDGASGFGLTTNHTYTSSGNYNVMLTVVNNSATPCMDTIIQTISITTTTCIANSNFTLSPTTVPQFWVATPASPWNVANAVWSWGDGSSSNVLYTSHTYSVAGNYQICLTVTASCGSTSSTCATYSITKMNNGMIHINVEPPQFVGINTTAASVNGIQFYPNPSNGFLNLELNSDNEGVVHVQVLDLSGKLVYENTVDAKAGEKTKQLNIQELPNGIYVLQLEQEGQRLNKKLVISKD